MFPKKRHGHLCASLLYYGSEFHRSSMPSQFGAEMWTRNCFWVFHPHPYPSPLMALMPSFYSLHKEIFLFFFLEKKMKMVLWVPKYKWSNSQLRNYFSGKKTPQHPLFGTLWIVIAVTKRTPSSFRAGYWHHLVKAQNSLCTKDPGSCLGRPVAVGSLRGPAPPLLGWLWTPTEETSRQETAFQSTRSDCHQRAQS